jgi:hypothetical protein
MECNTTWCVTRLTPVDKFRTRSVLGIVKSVPRYAVDPADSYTAIPPAGQRRPINVVGGSVNALTLEMDPDVNVNLFNCTPGSNGGGTTNNARGGSHSVAADPMHNQIYVPIASTAWIPSNQANVAVTGVCGGKLGNGAPARGSDANGCIAVFAPVGRDGGGG